MQLSGTTSHQYPSAARAALVLAILLVAYIVSYIDRQILSLMVNPIRADLDISDFQIGLLQGFAFVIFFCLMGVPLGRAADRVNRVYLITAGIAFWSLMTILCGFSNTFFALFVFRMGVGVGEAALAPAAYSILRDTFPPHRLVRATSVFAQGATLGAGLSLLIGGQVVDYMSTISVSADSIFSGLRPWQMAFVVVGFPGFIVAALVIVIIREPVRKGPAEVQAVSTLDAIRLLWNRREDYAPLYLCGVLLSIINFAAVTWFPTHMIRVFGLTAGEVGMALGLIHLFGALAGALAGVLLTEHFLRKGRKDAYLRTVIVVSALLVLTMIALFMPSIELTLSVWVIAVMLQSGYAGSVYAALNIVAPSQVRALATATLILMANLLGLALGTALIGGISEILFPNQANGIGKAMALVCATSAVLSCVIAVRSLPQFNKSVTRALAAD